MSDLRSDHPDDHDEGTAEGNRSESAC